MYSLILVLSSHFLGTSSGHIGEVQSVCPDFQCLGKVRQGSFPTLGSVDLGRECKPLSPSWEGHPGAGASSLLILNAGEVIP